MSNNEQFTRNLFTNIPVEYSIPIKTEVVFVSDYFASDLQGGAELTTDAIIKKCPFKVFQLHSTNLTMDMLKKNEDKVWIFGNYTSCSSEVLEYLPLSKTRYSVIEFDFKYCIYRSEQRHLLATQKPCDCPGSAHGKLIESFMKGAEHIFWMSEGQKNLFEKRVPALITDVPNKSVVQTSTFDDETLDKLWTLSTKYPATDELKDKKVYTVLGAGSWIKGVAETQKWCAANQKPHRPLPNLPYDQFLDEMAKTYGLVFMPLDWDTCPRLVIEAKLLGLDLILNDNVLHQNDQWFNQPKEEIYSYLRGRANFFWNVISGK